MEKLNEDLKRRTGKDTWIPARSGSEELQWNIEGDLFRNKGRLLSSLFILRPKGGSESTLQLLGFGRQLAQGRISEREFYNFIISNFRYPHPAYSENYGKWRSAGRELHPFIFLLQILIKLDELEPSQAYLTRNEIRAHIYPISDHSRVDEICETTLARREEKIQPASDSTGASNTIINRKITDIMGFLCITSYTYYAYGARAIRLNLIGRHPEEKVFFERNRDMVEGPQGIVKSLIAQFAERGD
jgi:hypothetical protein